MKKVPGKINPQLFEELGVTVFPGSPCEPYMTRFFEDQKIVRQKSGSRGRAHSKDEAEENTVYSPIYFAGKFRSNKIIAIFVFFL